MSDQQAKRPLEDKQPNRPRKRQNRPPKEEPSDAAKQAAHACLKKHPKYLASKLDDHLTPDPTVPFFPEEEAEAMALFDASQSKVDFEKFTPKENTNSPTVNDFRSVWKVCLRVFEWSPVLLISPLNGLKYRSVRMPQQSTHGPESSEPPEGPEELDPTHDPEESRPSKDKPSEVIFSPGFSQALFTLIVHPCWEGDAVLFLLALQFTVKCRVDNQEPWPRDDLLNRVSGLRTLRSMFDDPGREPIGIAEMMNAVHNSQTEDDRTTFSRFLHFLGGQVKSTPSDNQPQSYLGVDALPVTSKDLKFLTAAVTEFDWDEDSWNCSPDEVWRAFRTERGIGRDEEPITNADTKRYTLRSLKDAYRDIARQIRASRDGASRVEAPHRSMLDDNRENTAHDEEGDIPIDDIPLPLPDDAMETTTGHVSDIQTESTPFHPRPRKREPCRKALVDGEETEDEEEDLRRNLQCGNESNDTHVIPGARRRDQVGNGTMSGLSFESPFTLPTVPTSLTRPSARLVPLTPVGPGENLTQRLQEERLENRVKYSEASIKKLLDTQNCHSEAIRNLQRHAGLQILPPHQPERVNVPAPTQRVVVLETQNETLVQQNQALRERIHQMANHADQHRAEWSRKVNALELENSTLKATLSQKEEDLRAEMARVSNQQVEWSQKTRALEQENSTLLGIVSGKDEVIALQIEKVRSLETQLNTMKARQQEVASSTEETVQSSNHRIPSNDHALLGSQRVGLPVQMESPDHFKQESDVISQSDEFASLRGQIPSLEGDIGSPRREEHAGTFAPAFLGVNDDYLGWYNSN